MLTWLLDHAALAVKQVSEKLRPGRRVIVVVGDAPPDKMPKRDLVLLVDGGQEWSVAMVCPCGCRETLELPLIPEARPRWSLKIDKRRRPTLHPSVWKQDGCRSHYFVRAGKVIWV